MPGKVSFLLLGSMTQVLLVPLIARADEALLERVRVGHRATVEGIETFACRMLVKGATPDARGAGELRKYEESCSYWRSRGDIRVSYQVNGINSYGPTQIETLVRHSKIIGVTKNSTPDGTGYQSGVISVAEEPVSGNAWANGLLLFLSGAKDQSKASFHSILSQPHDINGVSYRIEADRDVICVDLRHANARLVLSFDPMVNYLVRKCIVKTGAAGTEKTAAEFTVTGFAQPAPGFFFPKAVVTKTFTDGVPDGGGFVTAFENVRINEPIDPKVFTIAYPPGALIGDTIQLKVFRADSQGRLVHMPQLNVSKRHPLPAAVNPSQVAASDSGAINWVPWLAAGSLLLVAVGAFGIWRRRKSGA